MKQTNYSWYLKGIRDGIPIALGYLAVSFTLGIAAGNSGIAPFPAAFMSLMNLTSAGEFAGLGLITAGAAYMEMAGTQLVINLRYCLMSCALSQKLSPKMPFFHRLLMAYGITDEIFGDCHRGRAGAESFLCLWGDYRRRSGMDFWDMAGHGVRQCAAGPGVKCAECGDLRDVYRDYRPSGQEKQGGGGNDWHCHGGEPSVYVSSGDWQDLLGDADHYPYRADCRGRCIFVPGK